MSRQTILFELVKAQRFFKIRSAEFEMMGIPESDQPRTMYVSAEVMAAVERRFADTEEGERLAEFRAWLDNFVEGGVISVSEDPRRKPPDTMLARVDPIQADFWSIRVTEPEQTAGIRSIGAFSDIDEFVALVWNMREVIDDQFDEEVRSAMDTWFDFFKYTQPHRGQNLYEYLRIHRAV